MNIHNNIKEGYKTFLFSSFDCAAKLILLSKIDIDEIFDGILIQCSGEYCVLV